jgi:hypothetical protein
MERKTPDQLPELAQPANTWVDEEAPRARARQRRRSDEDEGRVEFDPSSRGDEAGEMH